MNTDTSSNDFNDNDSNIEIQELEFSKTNSLFRLKIGLPEYIPGINDSAPDNGFEYYPAPIGLKSEENVSSIEELLSKESNCACPQVVENKISSTQSFSSEKNTITPQFTPFGDFLMSTNTPSSIEEIGIFESLDSFDPLDSQLILDDDESETIKTHLNTPPPLNVKQKYQNNSRKYKPDSIRKKIKSRTLKNIKNILNNKIKKAGGIMFFDYLPQEFVSNVKVGINKEVLDYSFRQLLTTDFCGKAKDKEKLSNNIRVLTYLDNNPEIRIKSGIDFLLKCSFKSLCNMYFSSSEFKKELMILKCQGEDTEYINKYKFLSFTWIDFFKSNGKLSKAFGF